MYNTKKGEHGRKCNFLFKAVHKYGKKKNVCYFEFENETKKKNQSGSNSTLWHRALLKFNEWERCTVLLEFIVARRKKRVWKRQHVQIHGRLFAFKLIHVFFLKHIRYKWTFQHYLFGYMHGACTAHCTVNRSYKRKKNVHEQN